LRFIAAALAGPRFFGPCPLRSLRIPVRFGCRH
jgi:hypothetical protein